MSTYDYDLQLDFPTSNVSPDRLTLEIKNTDGIAVALDRVDVALATDDVSIVFKAPLSSEEKSLLDAVVAAHMGEPLADPNVLKKDVEGRLLTSPTIPSGGGFRLVTHNFCDACTWWQGSVEVVDAPTTTGDNLSYTIDGSPRVVDVRHGRLTFEDEISDTTVAPNGNTMTHIIPVVSVDGVPLDVSNEDADSGDDRYQLVYDAGVVVFSVARPSSAVVTVSYRRPDSSAYAFKPPTGKKWKFEDAEVDVSEDLDMNATFMTTAYGSHTSLTGGSVVNVGHRTYKGMHDFQAAARRFWGPIPSGFGGSGGVSSPKWTFEWQYARSDIYYATPNYVDKNQDPEGVTYNRAECRIVGDAPYPGFFLTMTYYGQETDEENE